MAVGDRELEGALVRLREPTRPDAPRPVEPVRHAGAARRRRTLVVEAVAAVLVVVVFGGAVVRLAGRSAGTVETRAPGLSYGVQGPASPEQLDRTAELVKARLDQLGEHDAEVAVEGGGIVVRGAGDHERVAAAVAPSVLSFRPVLENLPPLPPATGGAPAGTVAPGEAERVEGAKVGDPAYKLGPSTVDGSVVQSAAANRSVQANRWTVNPVLRPGADGIDRFNALAAQCYLGTEVCPTKQMAIVVAGRVLSAPSINAPAFDADRIEISGGFTEEEARALAALLDLGNLPVVLAPR
jgi:preprotein translocase subunit SecD